MEEKVIIESTPSPKTATRLLQIGLALIVLGFWIFFATLESAYYYSPYVSHDLNDLINDLIYYLSNCMIFSDQRLAALVLYVGILVLIVSFIHWLAIKNDRITVTNKRVYGVTAWNKRVDLPLNQISAVATSWLKGIAVGTSSGKIVFTAIENHLDIHKAITALLAEQQDAAGSAPIDKQNTPASNADELKKYKDLLDSGVITQEEFDAKKKQLLRL